MRRPGKARATAARLSGPIGWAALAAVLVAALTVGSMTHGATGTAARIAHLDSIIKCPSCTDLSIAQSQAPQATRLRSLVSQWVHNGWSDARIEREVTSTYTSAEILDPTNWVVWAIPIAAVAAGAAGLLIYLLRRRTKVESITAADEAIVASFRRAAVES